MYVYIYIYIYTYIYIYIYIYTYKHIYIYMLARTPHLLHGQRLAGSCCDQLGLAVSEGVCRIWRVPLNWQARTADTVRSKWRFMHHIIVLYYT